MKKFNNLLTILIVSSASFTLAACGSGGSANNAATQQTNSSSGGSNAASNNTLPQVSTDDLKAIFTALATDSAKSTISLQDAVAIITGKNPDALQTLKAFNSVAINKQLMQLTKCHM